MSTTMAICEVQDRNETLIAKLYQIWRKSVEETHLFLSGKEVEAIAVYIPSALKNIPHLIIVRDNDREPAAFMGIQDQKLEMLFVSPALRGKGIGKQLIHYGIKHYSFLNTFKKQ